MMHATPKHMEMECVLSAGSGKTLISMLLIKDKINKMQESGTTKLVFFLAPKVDLVKQVCLKGSFHETCM